VLPYLGDGRRHHVGEPDKLPSHSRGVQSDPARRTGGKRVTNQADTGHVSDSPRQSEGNTTAGLVTPRCNRANGARC
jgi:hypothetical protein